MRSIVLFLLCLFIAGMAIAQTSYREYGDIVMGKTLESMQKVGVKPVLFPHWFHIVRFKCKVCHEDVFVLERGGNDINMNNIMKGQYCGRCHDGIIAWETLYCERCHNWEGPASPYARPVIENEGRIGKEDSKVSPIIDPTNPASIIYLDSRGDLAGTGDPEKSGPASEAARAGASPRAPALAAAGLPKDKYGLVDWTKAAMNKVIIPKHSLNPAEEEILPLDLNVLIESKGDFTNDVIFPHTVHTWWFKCETCHPKLFLPQKGANKMTMVDIVNGEFCGRCHGRVAFPLSDCTRCHTQPKPERAGTGK